MKSNLITRKQKFLRMLYGTLSLTTALFIFQCCYGTPQDLEDIDRDVLIRGKVKSKATNNPVPGIRVSVINQNRYEITDNTGEFLIVAYKDSEYKLRFEDIDSIQNGRFLLKDTIIVLPSENLDIKLDVE